MKLFFCDNEDVHSVAYESRLILAMKMMSLLLAGLGYALVALIPLLLLVRSYCSTRAANKPGKSIAVIVLGDIGRSPRMMYHAQSLAQSGYKVLLIGFAGQTESTPVYTYPS